MWNSKVEALVKKNSSIPAMSQVEFEKWLAREIPGLDVNGCGEIRKQLNTHGFIVDFSEELDLVIVEPQWLADIFRGVLSFKQQAKNGMLERNQLIEHWKQVYLQG